MKPKSKKDTKNEQFTELYEAILSLETLDECLNFFDDLLSAAELRAIEQRYQVARLLNDGHIYNEILEITGASSATISRVNRSLLYGKGSYDIIFNRLNKEKYDKKT